MHDFRSNGTLTELNLLAQGRFPLHSGVNQDGPRVAPRYQSQAVLWRRRSEAWMAVASGSSMAGS